MLASFCDCTRWSSFCSPTAIMSKITADAAQTKHYCAKSGSSYSNPQMCKEVTNNAVLLCLLGGVLNLVMGLLHLGFVIDFISYVTPRFLSTSLHTLCLSFHLVRNVKLFLRIPSQTLFVVISMCRQ